MQRLLNPSQVSVDLHDRERSIVWEIGKKICRPDVRTLVTAFALRFHQFAASSQTFKFLLAMVSETSVSDTLYSPTWASVPLILPRCRTFFRTAP